MKKVATSKRKRKSIKVNTQKVVRLMKGELVYVGIDVHKSTFVVCLYSATRGAILDIWSQPADIALLLKKLKRFMKKIQEIVYEAGPTGFALVRALREAGYNANVIAPSETPGKSGRRTKTDRIDSSTLAEYASKGLLHNIYVPTEREDADRQVSRIRSALSKKVRRVKTQIKSFLLCYGIREPEGLESWSKASVAALTELDLDTELKFCLDTLLLDYKHFVAQMKRLDSKVRALAKTERHKEAVECMRTVAGVGLITATIMRLELPNPERFNSGREITSSVGLVPHIAQTGEHTDRG